MKCPRCAAITRAPITRCSGCGFSIEALDRVLGSPGRIEGPLDDGAQLFSPADHLALAGLLNDATARSGGRWIVATRLTTAPASPAEYAFWLLNRASFASPATQGILVLLAMREQRIETEVTAGWEDIATDLATGRILDRDVLPLLHDRDYAGALRAAVVSLVANITRERTS